MQRTVFKDKDTLLQTFVDAQIFASVLRDRNDCINFDKCWFILKVYASLDNN